MSLQYQLPDGTLTLQTQGDVAADELFTLAARNNPNRAFLFVSKVLGKHLAIPPARMATIHAQLAEKLRIHLAKDITKTPLLFIGMAETATALARGVYDQWLRGNPMQDSLYLATSRYCLADHQRLEFSEAHSHAPGIGLHLPSNVILRQRFEQAQMLVLIDDELSTGNTFVNLIHSLQAQGLPLTQVIMVTLTDFSTTHAAQVDVALMPLQVNRISLLQGQWYYHAHQVPNINHDWQTQNTQRITLPADSDLAGRGGTDRVLQFSDSVRANCEQFLGNSQRLLVLGCGEFMYAPYRLAALAAEFGVEVRFCATTRSPIRTWGPIQDYIEWQDPYGEGVRNFLYNYQRSDYDAVWFVSELPGNAALYAATRDLEARLLYLPTEHTLEDHTVY